MPFSTIQSVTQMPLSTIQSVTQMPLSSQDARRFKHLRSKRGRFDEMKDRVEESLIFLEVGPSSSHLYCTRSLCASFIVVSVRTASRLEVKLAVCRCVQYTE